MLAALIGFVVLLGLCFAGIPLFVSMLLVGTFGFAYFRGIDASMTVVGQQITDAATSYGFSVIPLFILMGAFIHRGGLADELFDAARAWLGHKKGGMAHATIGASGAFSAVCGSSLATAAIMAKVSLPQLKRYRYEDGFAGGTVAAGGTLGILIPPSVPLVIFGILTETDIAKLFIAGIVPGMLLALLYMLSARIVVSAKPGSGDPAEPMPLRERFHATKRTGLVALLIVAVIGGMYIGVFTPTEAAAVGAAGALVMMLLRRRTNFRSFKEALTESTITTAVLLVVAGSAFVFNNFLTVSGLTAQLVDWINGLAVPPWGVILAICLIYILLGCVFDSLSAMILTVPVFTPIVIGLGYDPIWFGILVAMTVELGLITPPLGMNVFIVQSLAPNVSVWSIFRGVAPYIVANVIALLMVALLPQIATFLPSHM